MSAIEEKKTKPPDKPTDYFKCIKIPLKHVLKNPDINLPKITDAVIKCNKIVINTLMFMKLYLLDYFEKNNKLPEIDKVFVNSCMKIMCNESVSGRPPKKEIKDLKDNFPVIKDSKEKKRQSLIDAKSPPVTSGRKIFKEEDHQQDQHQRVDDLPGPEQPRERLAEHDDAGVLQSLDDRGVVGREVPAAHHP